jgi:hypothetical protein
LHPTSRRIQPRIVEQHVLCGFAGFFRLIGAGGVQHFAGGIYLGIRTFDSPKAL